MFLKIALFSFTLYLVNSSVAFANYTEYGLDGKNVYGETEDEIIDPVAEEDDSEDYDSTSEVLSDSASSKATANSRCCAESKTYIIGKQLVKHAAASTLCQRIGMELATVMSPKEERALVKTWKSFGVGRGLAAHEQRTVWLGGIRCPECSSEFIWDPTGKPVVYTHFQKDQPNNVGKSQNCLLLQYGLYKFNATQKNSFGWNDYDCQTKQRFACQSRCCSN
ncbi:C-type lectin domain family 18 member A [Dendroctonus ponderosae]|uniref:C-type lectin domain-containing protein n=1 Tax=Dendroctonus ponderosae TaxID=77166 RepID=A0AAR5PB03_DENPD|nr:C-type lectin domain family 18 member A [Dendroctonus ponderosae]